MPKAQQKLTADVLTPQQMLEHRVIFLSSSSGTVRLLTDREISETRCRMLSTLLGCRVQLQEVRPESKKKASKKTLREIFYQTLASCSMLLEPKVLRDLPTDIIVKHRVIFLQRDEQGRMVLLTDRLLQNAEMAHLERICGGEIVLEFVHNKPDFAGAFASIMEASGASMEDDLVFTMPESERAEMKPANRRIQHRGARKKTTS